MSDTKLDSPSFHRNIEPITELFHKAWGEEKQYVLEIGSGSGQHVERFASEFPNSVFQPTDLEPHHLESIDAWASETDASNIRKAERLDITEETLPFSSETRFDVFIAFNVVHITTWAVTEALFRTAKRCGSDNARVFLYGPFKFNGEQTSESNARFEEWLKEKDTEFGVRDIADVADVARQNQFMLSVQHAMPANNFMMEFARTVP